MYNLTCELKWGKYPKMQILSVKEYVKEDKPTK
jgi:hypothetical protein